MKHVEIRKSQRTEPMPIPNSVSWAASTRYVDGRSGNIKFVN